MPATTSYVSGHPWHPEQGWLAGVPNCFCGVSYEDCAGDCYENSLSQLRDPETGENTLPQWCIDTMDSTELAVARRWGRWN